MTKTSITSQTIAVEHIRISSEWPFAEVRRNLEGAVPKLVASIADVLRSGDQERARRLTKRPGQSCRSSSSAIMVPTADCGQQAQRAPI
jgi:hypothetical protein